MKEAVEFEFDDDEVEKAVMGCYSHYIMPQTPKARGSVGLTRTLYGILDEYREKKVLWILETTPQDMNASLRRFAEKLTDSSKKRVVLCGKSAVLNAENSRKIISMPL